MKHVDQHVHDSNARLVRSVQKHEALYDNFSPKYSLKQHTDQAWQEVAVENGQSVKECRLKWRNLRISYLRYLRQLKNPAKNVRPYYLLNEMSFMEPFVRHSGEFSESFATDQPVKSHNTLRTSTAASSDDKPKYEYQMRSDDDDNIVFTFMNTNPKEEDIDEDEENDPIEQVYTTSAPSSPVAVTPITASIKLPLQHYGTKKTTAKESEPKPPETSTTQDETTNENPPPHNYTEQLLLELSHPDLSFFRSILPDVETMTQAQKSRFKLAVLSTLDDILYSA